MVSFYVTAKQQKPYITSIDLNQISLYARIFSPITVQYKHFHYTIYMYLDSSFNLLELKCFC